VDLLENGQYRTKIESNYTDSEAHRMWQGLKTIMDYKGKPSRELPSDASLTDELNAFYVCFEASNTEACMRTSAVPGDWITRSTMCTQSMREPTGKCLH
jgi:hypothetical protein